jgi:CubicO group peptidase (beta-lactamase class C family)
VASITKPVVAMGVMLLIERGELTLGTRVTDIIPEFGRNGKYGVDVRHLLTHTSGLPDMLPDNERLRAGHASFAQFLAATCEASLGFPPGKAVQYQSSGFIMLAELIQRISGRNWQQYLREELFQPLGLKDTVLGAPDEWFDSADASPLSRVVEVRLTPQQAETDWNWNSRYWRQLGAPWGGMLTTTDDLALIAEFLLRNGQDASNQTLLSPAAVAAMICNQLEPLRDVPEADRRTRSWGLGWRRHWPGHSANFGDLLGCRTYGHWGATGTVMWIDPDQDFYGIMLSSQPQEPAGWFLARMSNVIASAWD